MAIEIDPDSVEPRAILEMVDFRNCRVLEVGAGDGRLTFQYAEMPRSVVGVDTKEQEIRTAVEVSGAEFCGRTRFLCASGVSLPFPAEEFEIVLLASSL